MNDTECEARWTVGGQCSGPADTLAVTVSSRGNDLLTDRVCKMHGTALVERARRAQSMAQVELRPAEGQQNNDLLNSTGRHVMRQGEDVFDVPPRARIDAFDIGLNR